ncbi:BPTD_3080 family restriction endonuclease [Lentisalinibacter salinarum]|uniref:BPTD_3080 family restriction endonuclease n=1 Tax=Lentisalinibacter salinarum TaxID=2992239 RepID=UPI0038649470
MPQINAVKNPIINSPYEEPQKHWHIEEGKAPIEREGRRPASYFFRVPESAGRGRVAREQEELFDAEAKGEEYLLDNANLLRQRVKEWQERGYPGATRTTRELIDLWRGKDRAQPLFFAQLEAAETIIFLVEGPIDLQQGIIIPEDEPGPTAKEAGYKAFLRYALKMATGTGKTTVMGMLAAWSILNKVTDPHAPEYSDTVLVICPNITIRDRLRELDPTQGNSSLYRSRELVPAHRMADLRRGEVFITNWHNLDRREISEVNGQGARVVKRGEPVVSVRTINLSRTVTEEDVRYQETVGAFDILEEQRKRNGDVKAFTVRETKYLESDAAFVRRILGGRKGRSSAIFVMNDESHHAYRRGTNDDDAVALDEETAKANAREATVWIEGLDRLNKKLGGKANGIRMCVDLSATPFYIQGSGNEVGKPFPWVVSDFSLLEAIEAGLVKVPQLPTEDTSGDETPAYFNIWRWVQKRAQQDGHIGPITTTEVMRYATAPIMLLADEWRKTIAEWTEHFRAGKRREDVPPVFIIVCRDTALAKAMYDWLAEGDEQYGAGVAEFRNSPGSEMTVRIDSKVGEDIAAGGSKDETRRLRFVLETIGRTVWPGGHIPEEYGELVDRHNRRALEDEDSALVTINASKPPGRDVRCIISVSMLSEGWDATTVTHVVGLRPFGSQLLCEQVVGRALRRTSYAVDPKTSRFTEETAQIFGVPFELIPFKVEGGKPPPPSPPANHIYADPEKSEYEIEFPVVEGFQDRGIVQVAIDWDQVGDIVIDPSRVPDRTLVQGLSTADGRLTRYGPGEARDVSIDDWRKTIRTQQVAFALAKQLTLQWKHEYGEAIPTHRLFPQMLQTAMRFLDEHVECEEGAVKQDALINPYFDDCVKMLINAMSAVSEEGEAAEQAVIASGPAGVRTTATVDFHTGKQLHDVTKCHLNGAVFDSDWERQAGETLDASASVRAWVKNDRLGLFIPYRKHGASRQYLPDFVVETRDDGFLMIEIKGQLGDALLKKAAAERWCRAVSKDGRFGQWTYHLCFGASDLEAVLAAYGDQ